MNTVADDKLAHVVPDNRSAEHYRTAFAAENGGAARGIAVLHGLTGQQAEVILERAVHCLEHNAERLADASARKFSGHEYDSPYASLDALRALHRTAQLFPDAVWTIEESRP